MIADKYDHGNPRFRQAAAAFLGRFGLGAGIQPDAASLKKIYRAFGHLPYENVSKIINYHDSGSRASRSLRDPAEVIEGFLAERLGGTCFSLTQTLAALLGFCGFDCYRVLGDMSQGTNIHCAVVVRLSGEKYLCDAGYLVPEPLRVGGSGRTTLKGPLYSYLLEADPREANIYHLYTRSPAGKTKWRYLVRDRPVNDRVFTHYWKLTFEAPMNRHLLLTRNSEKGQIYIHKHKLRLTSARGHANSNIRPCIPEKIEEFFGIDRERVAGALSLIGRLRLSERSKAG